MSLPRRTGGVIPADIRFSIGLPGAGEKSAPSMSDSFRLVLPEIRPGAKWYAPHSADSYARSHFGTGPDRKVLALPVRLRSNDPDQIWTSYLARFEGALKQCECHQFAGEGDYLDTWQGTARQAIVERRKGRDGKEFNVKTGTTQIVCQPAKCEHFKARTCRPAGVLTFSLGPEWGEWEGLVGEFRTSGRMSCDAIDKSLAELESRFSGRLTGMSLLLAVTQRPSSTPVGSVRNFSVVRLMAQSDKKALAELEEFHGRLAALGHSTAPVAGPSALEIAEAEDETGQPEIEFYQNGGEPVQEEEWHPVEPEPVEPPQGGATEVQVNQLRDLDAALAEYNVPLAQLVASTYEGRGFTELSAEEAAGIIAKAERTLEKNSQRSRSA